MTTMDENSTAEKTAVVASPLPAASTVGEARKTCTTADVVETVVNKTNDPASAVPSATPASSTTSSASTTAVAAATTTTSTPTTASKAVVQLNKDKEPKIVERQQVELLSAVPENKEDNLTYNFADMTAFDITPIKIDESKLNNLSAKNKALVTATRDNVQLLVNKLFSLPQESAETGTVAVLRGHFDSPAEVYRLPRQKPCPKQKEKTRWEKFAEARGIEKKKRSKMVWDETVGGWSRRYGYKSVKQNAENAEWAIEVKEDGKTDPMEDPFKKRKTEKKLNMAKQKLREMRNKVEQAGFKLAPVSLEKTGENVGTNSNRGKDGLKEALKRAQTSSGSRGKFDRLAKKEEVVKKRGGKKKLVAGGSNSGAKVEKNETSAVLKTFDKVQNGGFSSKVNSKTGQFQAASEKKAKKGVVKKTSKRGGGKGGKGRGKK